MKKITIFKEENNVGAEIYDDDSITRWEKLTKDEQIELLSSIIAIYELFSKFVKKE